MDEDKVVEQDQEQLDKLEKEIEATRNKAEEDERKAHDQAPRFYDEGGGGEGGVPF